MKFDLIIPTAGKDCFLVRKTLKLILEHLIPENIYIITKAQYFIYFKYLNQGIKDKVIIIDEDILLENINYSVISTYLKNVDYNTKNTGWYYQQFLKMGFALTGYASRYYLTWDADTLPIKRIDFFNKYGTPYFTLKDEFHKPYFITIKKLLNLEKSIGESFIAENMLFDVQIMKKLISKIEQSTILGNNWCEKIINVLPANMNNSFSEFETYGTFVLNYFPQEYELRTLRAFRNCGQYYSRMCSIKKLEQLSSEYDMISLEHRDNPKYPIGFFSLAQKGVISYLNRLLVFLNIK